MILNLGDQIEQKTDGTDCSKFSFKLSRKKSRYFKAYVQHHFAYQPG